MTIINNEPKVHIEDHLLISDIDELMSECNIYIRLYERLLAIKMLKKGLSIDETTDFVNVSPRTVYNWLKTYNKKGLAGLIPNFGGGRPSYLSDKDLTELNLIMSDKNANYTIDDVRKLIKDKYGIEYSYKQVWFITKKKLGLNYGKPSPFVPERSLTRKEDLKKT